ncbi:MAG: transposase [Bacteroidales bacterium]|nr:transposase [Bacteroidales bacterium]
MQNNVFEELCNDAFIKVVNTNNLRFGDIADEQKENNRNKAKKRCRIEHVFGFMEQSMKGLFFRGVGILRATFYIGFTNLIYNMCRLVQIKKYYLEFVKVQ